MRVGPICRQSVKNILIEHGLDPGPKRGKGTWSDFLRIHAETLWQVDFFSKDVWTITGPQQIFALAFIHLATRRVFVTPGTIKPNAVWVESQACAFLDHAAAEQLPCGEFTSNPRDCWYTHLSSLILSPGVRRGLNGYRYVSGVPVRHSY